MKHSASIKYPSKFLIVSIVFCLLFSAGAGVLIYLKYQQSQKTADGQKSAVTQFNKTQYNKAVEILESN